MRAEGWTYRIVLALSGITLVLVVVYLFLTQENRSVQAEVNQRQQFINQSIEFNRINNALIHALAATAVNAKDDKLRDLLTQNGIMINPATGAPFEKAAPPASATPAEKGK
jgi:succinate dehydrogenase hydrophobic anchor subunit